MRRAFVWVEGIFTAITGMGILCAFLGFGYGLTLMGCRNDAISFAKSLYDGQVSCNAIKTSIGPGEDMAVCKIRRADGSRMTVICTSGRPVCRDAFAK